MALLRASLLALAAAIDLLAQTPFAAIADPRARVEAIRNARKQLTGRTDVAAMAQWSTILAEMNLAKDPELKDLVQSLRALNLYDNESWNSLVIVGYTYLGASESAQEFRSELARRRPDSNWAIQAAIQQWERNRSVRPNVRLPLVYLVLVGHLQSGIHNQHSHRHPATFQLQSQLC
jgi:hypothetical protein